MIYSKLPTALLGALLITGCGDDATESSAASPPPVPPAATPAPAPAPAKERPGLARAVSTGKTTAGVELYYEIARRPAVGVPVDIELVLDPTVELDRVTATLEGMDGLRIASAESVFQATQLAAGDEFRRTVTVVPETAGTYYLSVVVKTDGITGVQARSFAIPLVAGDAAAPAEKASTSQTDASGEPIRSLPAQESGA
jgi:hypothetical protein